VTGRVHVIAEAGTNHNGDLNTARRLVDAAAGARADSVKFQLIYPEGLYLPRFYRDGHYEDNEVFAQRSAAMLTDDDYRELAEYCRSKSTPFTATVFDTRGIELVDELDVPYIKTASCDLNNSRLLVAAAETGRRMVISTGMAGLDEIERAVSDVTATGNTDLVLMHCVSVYPCPAERMNLGFVAVLRESFGFPVGLSDHTEGSVTSAAAIGLGAEWIEKHFTLDRSSPGFDHAYAMEPEALAGFVADVRQTSSACEIQEVKVLEDEQGVRTRARRSIYAARDIEEGEEIREDDLLVVRPEGPLSPNDLPLVVGRTAKRRIFQYEPLSLEATC